MANSFVIFLGTKITSVLNLDRWSFKSVSSINHDALRLHQDFLQPDLILCSKFCVPPRSSMQGIGFYALPYVASYAFIPHLKRISHWEPIPIFQIPVALGIPIVQNISTAWSELVDLSESSTRWTRIQLELIGQISCNELWHMLYYSHQIVQESFVYHCIEQLCSRAQ